MSAAPQQKQIRFVNNQGQPPSKRRRINAACFTCRKRKTRCAGERPICSTCTKNGHECLGYTDIPDKKNDDAAGDRQRDAHGSADEAGVDDFEDEPAPETVAHEKKSFKARSNSSPHDGGTNNGAHNHATPASQHTHTSTPGSRQQGPKSNEATPRPSLDVSHAKPDHERRGKGQNAQRQHRQSTVPPPPPPPRPPPHQRQHSFQSQPPLAPPPSSHRPLTSASDENHSATSQSPVMHFKERLDSHRVPYFRYFGPTAIVPGYKQMVVSVRGRRRSTGGSASGTSPSSAGIGHVRSLASVSQADSEAVIEDLPVYDVNDAAPVHPLIMHLVKLFFTHLGCNYPFLKEERFTRMVEEKRVEGILVDAMCALSARFSDAPQITHDGKLSRSEYGQQYAQRAKAATVDTFPAPSVGAVQALLMMAYEGFGANQDSALWMYLGLAIRMAVDLGLQKMVGVQYQGEKDPWYIRHCNRASSDAESVDHPAEEDTVSRQQQMEVEQERMDTFWTVFILDRVISSGTGRPVTFRDDDFEFALPPASVDVATGWPNPFPTFVRIIHLYGRVSDVLNKIHHAKDLTHDKWAKLAQMESELTRLYQNQDPGMHFNVGNFKAYLTAGQATTFILMHFWFHAMIIILHQPTLLTPFGSLSRSHQLLPNSRELSMSSAKTIADILSFAELIGPTSFIGNPFTSQPMYIAACAFLMESAAMVSQPTSRDASPPPSKANKQQQQQQQQQHQQQKQQGRGTTETAKSTKHSLLASAANQNYLRCYNSLQQLHQYWGGTKYILTALDQKSKGIWDVETYTDEEYESAKMTPGRHAAFEQLPPFENLGSPSTTMPPFAWSITGATNSPTSSLTLMYQNMQSGTSQPHPSAAPSRAQQFRGGPSAASHGHTVYDPLRHGHQESHASMYSPPYPQAATSALRHSPEMGRTQHQRLQSNSSIVRPSSQRRYNAVRSPGTIAGSPGTYRNSPNAVQLTVAPPQQHSHSMATPQAPYQSNSHQAAAFDASMMPSAGTNSALSSDTPSSSQTVMGSAGMYDPNFGGASYSYMDQGIGPIGDLITYENPVDIGALGLPNDMMPQWLDYLPSDVLGMFENGGNMEASDSGVRGHDDDGGGGGDGGGANGRNDAS